MHIEWYGQSAFRLTDGSTTVFIDPFGDMSPARERGMRWDYRTERIEFLEPLDAFARRAPRLERLPAPGFDREALPAGDTPLIVVPAAP